MGKANRKSQHESESHEELILFVKPENMNIGPLTPSNSSEANPITLKDVIADLPDRSSVSPTRDQSFT